MSHNEKDKKESRLSPCCQPAEKEEGASWIAGTIRTPIGKIPLVRTKLTGTDILGGWKVRWNIKRGNYKIRPGLYGVGNPDRNSRILVTANYKFTFDSLRRELSGLSLWILVLDTRGINVWCAAGKGTFGTKELIKRIMMSKLDQLVSHRQLIVPQLGAVGVAAHLVKKATGFRVIYGPIRAKDLPAFLHNDLKPLKYMRKVEFNLKDRLVLIPVELVESLKLIPVAFVILFIIGLAMGSANVYMLFPQLILFTGALLTGTVIFPLLIPWIPGRAFAFKGWLLGISLTIGYTLITAAGIIPGLTLLLSLPPVIAFLALNFTGCTTFTSLSGVTKEIKYAYPLFGISLIGGLILKVLYGL